MQETALCIPFSVREQHSEKCLCLVNHAGLFSYEGN